ncbi:rRNA processing protein [Schizosaccharomyces cryophilus OY26]|uniref:U three protein 23 n=1 Tax=Schizosaccharomyces cryophilus (strain OY26 / ATCC MYA-4695 / CBS 11777 / NBRC 106824 / NRRL Y48691) TaxID=653667 RepID=S9X295_SCHCR|nr:rRNA processing protein [Schizosaccharomyces cryophilus OY26]EPY51227.1 rRNA processing protein [Schizosaccharomyces cryophilus OY26]
MRQKRAKTYRKLMHTYQLVFGFREPYQVLVDADFISDLTKSKMDIRAAISRTVQGDIKPMVTQCCIRQLYSRSQEAKQEIQIAKSFERRRCGHIDEAKSPLECMQSCIDVNGRNKHRYVVATQNTELRDLLRSVPGVPLIYMKRSVVVLEPASRATILEKHAKESSQMGLSKEEKLILSGKRPHSGSEREETEETGKEDDNEASENVEEQPKKKKRKGPKGPNPLSVRKKKKSASQSAPSEGPLPVNIIGDVGQRRKHRRKRD